MSIQEENFKKHLKEVAKATTGYDSSTDFEERPLTLDELKELAISMGLTEEGWKNLLIKANTHLKSADDHLKARNFEEAIAEAEQAVAINPYIENGNAVLAKGYLMLWLEDHNKEYSEKAEYHARKELLVDPMDQMAVNVLSTINKKSKVLNREGKSRKTILFAIGGGILLIILMLTLFNKNAPKEVNNAIRNQLIEAEENVISKWDLVQVSISQRNDMVPELFRAVETSNDEVEVLNGVIEDLKNEIKNAEGEERFQLENEMDAKVQEAKELVRKYGNQSATEKLLIQIEGSENRIAFEKKNYNEAVKNYNILVKKNQAEFPEYKIKPYFNEN